MKTFQSYLVISLMVVHCSKEESTSTPSGTPVTKATAIAVGPQHACAVIDGAVKCWGNNVSGELGNGESGSSGQTLAKTVTGLTSGATKVATGGAMSCAIVSGGVKCWGSAYTGALGDAAGTARALTPVQVAGLTSNVTDIAVSGSHACAVQSGKVKCWGSNSAGQLGQDRNLVAFSSTPVEVAGLSDMGMIVAGGKHTCAAAYLGSTVYCWGANNHGQLGNGTTADTATPTALSSKISPVAFSIGGEGTNAHTCAVADDHSVRCWGANDKGQLGNDSTTDSSSPVLVPRPAGVTREGAVMVAAGYKHTCAGVSGKVYCWGSNDRGQLGNGSTADSKTAVEASGLTWSTSVTLAAGGVGSSDSYNGSFSCALFEDGSIKCWGWGHSGQLGDGTDGGEHSSLTPIAVRE